MMSNTFHLLEQTKLIMECAYTNMLAIIFTFKTVLHFTLGSPLVRSITGELPPPSLSVESGSLSLFAY